MYLTTSIASRKVKYSKYEASKDEMSLFRTKSAKQLSPSFNSWSKYPGTFFSWYEDDVTQSSSPDTLPEDSWETARGARFKLAVKGWTAVMEASAIVDDTT
ncbi:hypothetical protein ARMGADRAFT_1029506 [Armillaria gallica]|uniref:Uncharacterized protein n=1 Tax=Armillaria gallica TaxID=47427 RepID=A0A2H3DJX0_ARMGA|nr:hypothetical protein ARMGADRAFT_1029506 [Armillaria gallica]